MEPAWDDPSLRVGSDGRRTATYGLLQSWCREHVLYVRPASTVVRDGSDRFVGSLLHVDEVAQRP